MVIRSVHLVMSCSPMAMTIVDDEPSGVVPSDASAIHKKQRLSVTT